MEQLPDAARRERRLYVVAAECIRDGGTVVNATPWGAGSSSLWVRFYYSNANTPQTAWFPVAWVDFSNGGGTGNLQRC